MNKKIQIIAILFLAGIFLFQSFGLISADTTDDQIKAQEKEAEKYRKLIEMKQQQEKTLSNQLSIIEIEDKKLEVEIDIKKTELETVSAQIERLSNQILEYERSIQSQRFILKNVLQTYYENKRGDSILKMLGESNFYSILRNDDGITQTGEKLGEVLENIQSLKEKLDSEKEIQTQKQVELSELTDKLNEKNKALDISKDQKKDLLQATQGEEAKYQKLLASIENEIYELEAKKFADYGSLPPAKGDYFNYPVSTPVTTQGYGCLKDSFARRSYPSCDGGKGGFHNGIDFGKNSGLNIYTVKSGTVIESGDNKGYAYGKWIAVDHGDGLVTLYAHFSDKYVSKGSKVKAGAKIGKMGSTGYSTGNHLHFSVFDKKSFEIVKSKNVSGLYIPTGASVNPGRYF